MMLRYRYGYGPMGTDMGMGTYTRTGDERLHFLIHRAHI